METERRGIKANQKRKRREFVGMSVHVSMYSRKIKKAVPPSILKRSERPREM